jgi:hypothetical protein
MRTPIAPVQSRWRRSSLTETDASDLVSAACYRHPEDVGAMPIVVAEFELRDVQRHIFLAHLVERANHAALEDRPEAFDCLSVHRTNNIFASGVVNRLVRIFLAEVFVANPFIGAKQTDLVGDGFADKAFQGCGLDILNDARNNVAPALNGTGNNGFTAAASPSAAIAALALVSVFGEAADESFVNLDDADELLELLVLERRTNAMAYIPSGFVGAEAHVAVDLPRAHTLLARQHQVDDAKPLPQIDIRVLKDRSGYVGEPIAAWAAIGTLPFPFHGFEWINPRTATARAVDAIRPAVGHEVGVAGVLRREGRFPLGDGHLVDLAGLLCAGHDGSPYRQERTYHV